MSRLASTKASPTTKRDARTAGIGDGQNEICPVCKSSRYLTPSLRFLINPECYHKMCESCVDRIFSHGPAQCPIPGCRKTLRKARFRPQRFEDLKVEREVDIRKKVAAVFNKREEEFETLRDWNDYLNEVEDITFNLIEGVEIEETEKRFEAYQQAHERDIFENANLEEQERQDFARQKKAERDLARERRDIARREDADERRETEENRKDVLNRLASGQDAEKVTAQGQQVTLKKRMDRQAAAERQRQLHAADNRNNGSSSNLVIKGLRAKQKAEPEAPIDPFGGLLFEPRLYSVQDDYVWEGVRDAKADTHLGAGGYSVRDFTTRALCEAFAGLGVFVGEESAERDKMAVGEGAVGTVTAVAAAKDTKRTDDVF